MANLAARAAKSLPKRFPIPEVKQIILVASGKGGVGKSTATVNLACAVGQLEPGKDIGILDADVFGPSIPRMLNLSGSPEVTKQGTLLPLQNFGLRCMSMGFLVEEEEAVVWRGLRVMQAIETLIRKVRWGPLDYLFVDMPPGTGDVQLSLTQHLPIDGAVIVSTPQLVALADAKKAISMFADVSVPVLGLIENMATFRCPNCGTISRIFGDSDAIEALAEKSEVPVLGQVPLCPEVVAGMDRGRPAVLADPESAFSSSFLSIAEGLLKRLPPYEPSKLQPSRKIEPLRSA